MVISSPSAGQRGCFTFGERPFCGVPLEQGPCVAQSPRIGSRKTKKEIGTMDAKPAQNIQDTFLNTVRKDKSPITIYLVSGVKLTGRIRSFDKYSVLLESNNQEQLIFKHAISTVVGGRPSGHADVRPPLQPAEANGH
jgi:host factor-I protein